MLCIECKRPKSFSWKICRVTKRVDWRQFSNGLCMLTCFSFCRAEWAWVLVITVYYQLLCLLHSRNLEQIISHTYLRCNVPWPNCFQLLIVQRQSYQAWKFGHKGQPWPSPWCQAPNPRGWLVARICLQKPRCSTHWCVPVGVRRCPRSFQWVQCHVHQKWFPRTGNK